MDTQFLTTVNTESIPPNATDQLPPVFRMSETMRRSSIESSNAKQQERQYTFYCLNENAIRSLMDKPSKGEVSLSEKVLLTVEEAAAYTGLGINKIRKMTDSEDCPFVVWNHSKRMIKRKKFEAYLEKCYSI